MKHVKFIIPIYNAPVYVVSDVAECNRLAGAKCLYTGNDIDYDAKGLTINGNGNNIVWLPSECSMRTMAHEAMHVVLNIFHMRGIEVDTNNQEPTTYMVGHVVSEVLRAHNKLKEQDNG